MNKKGWGCSHGGAVPACLVLLVLAGLALPAAAQKVKEGRSTLDDLAFSQPELRAVQQPEERDQITATTSPQEMFAVNGVLAAYDSFVARTGGRWSLQVDRVTGRPALIEGSMPWIPGSGNGNTLTPADLGLAGAERGGTAIPVALVARKALDFLRSNPDLLGVDPNALQLVEASSGPVLDYLYFLHFQWTYAGLPVDGAYVVFRLNHGNLVQFGEENIADAIYSLDPTPSIALDTAWANLSAYIGGMAPDDRVLDPGHLLVIPVSGPSALAGAAAVPGKGLAYRLVYEVHFRRPGVVGTWQARIDAHTGEVLSFLDTNRYGSIKGGVYKTDQPATEVSVPFPYADYGGTAWADIVGNFTGTSGTSTMTGRTGGTGMVGGVDIVDDCGTISLASDAAGLINFGTSAATDCSSPGGGPGNTRAARTQYYNISMIKIKAYTYLPTNTWLQGRITDTVNIQDTCNAYWDGTGVNFFRSGGGCWNTGELPGVSLHEWAHGLDANDGSPAGDKGTGETYGDFSGVLQTHGSCAGNGFFLTYNSGCGTTTPGYNCGGYGDCCIQCSGIRQLDYAKHAAAKPHFAEDLTSNTCTGCTAYACSKDQTYAGPCGYEGHCESLVSSEAMWDLPVRDLVTWGMDAASAWQLMDRLWYASRSTSGSVYACPSLTTTNGCGTSNYFTTFRVVDDCDGDLSNGTPHASAIYNAFNRHKIACTTVVNTDQTNCCPSLAAPVLSGTAGNMQVSLSWASVTNAVTYYVYRNETGCDAGYTKVGTVTAPTLTFADSPLSNGVAYYYRLQAVGSSDACASPMSNCVTVTPVSCTLPAAPTGVVATTTRCTDVQVSWNAVAGATSYNLLRGTTCGAVVTTFTGVASPYTDTSAVAGTSYQYWVVAVNTCGTGANSSCAAGTRLAAPAAPTGVAATSTRCTDVQISWNAVTGATSYNVLRGSACGTTLATFTNVTSPYTDTSAVAGTSYQYWVVASNACGTSANSACATGTRAVTPAAPTGVAATANLCTGVAVSWDAVGGATSYNLLRGTACGTVLTTLTGVTSPYVDTSAVAGTTYQYWVVAVNACGSSTGSACASGLRLAPPDAPSSLSAAPTAYNNVDLTWPAVTGATGYKVYRTTGTCPQASYALITPSPLAGTSYSDGTVSGSTTYAYVVTAVSGTCESANGPCAAATTTAAPCTTPPAFAGLATVTPVTAATCALQLDWAAAAPACGGSITYSVYRSITTGFTPGPANLLISGVTGLTYTDASAASGTPYYYIVRAVETPVNLQDWNVVERNGTPGVPVTTVLFSDDFESGTGLNGWSTGYFSPDSATTEWYGIMACTAHSGSNIFRWGNSTCTGNYGRSANNQAVPGGTAGITVPAGASSVRLSFYHKWQMSSGDGLMIRLAIDDEALGYYYIPASATGVWLAGGYNGSVDYSPTGANRDMWNGTTANYPNNFVFTQMDLDDAVNFALGGTAGAAGHVLFIGFGGYSDSGTLSVADGWFLDDVRVTYETLGACTSCAAPSGLSNNTAADVDPCAYTGVSVTWAQDPGTSWGDQGTGTRTYDVLRDGTKLNATPIPYGTTSYTDTSGNAAASYTYAVRYTNGCGLNAATTGLASADLNGTPAPVITGESSNPCPATTAALAATPGMASYQWYLDGGPITGATASNHDAAAAGSYTVSCTSVSGCSATSAPFAVTLAACVVPPEVAPGVTPATAQTWTGTSAHSWPAEPAATSGYTLYRGTQADLPNLVDATLDSCVRYTGTATTVDTLSEDPALVPGRFYWYIVTGANGTGEGTAGSHTALGTAQDRVVNANPACP